MNLAAATSDHLPTPQRSAVAIEQRDTPTKAAIWRPQRVPSSGRPAMSVEHTAGPTQGRFVKKISFSRHTGEFA